MNNNHQNLFNDSPIKANKSRANSLNMNEDFYKAPRLHNNHAQEHNHFDRDYDFKNETN